MKIIFFISLIFLISIASATVDDSYTTSLLHYNTIGGSTDFIDENPLNIWLPRSEVTISGENLPVWINNTHFDGIDDYIETASIGTDSFNLSVNNWTWDSRILFLENSTEDTQGIFVMGIFSSTSGVYGATLTIKKSSYDMPYLYLTVKRGLVTIASFRHQLSPSEFDENTWHHIQIERCGNISIYTEPYGWAEYLNIRLFIDGNDTFWSGTVAPWYTSMGNMPNMTLGRNDASEGNFFEGRLDETRFSCGICRNTSNFTVPSGPYEPIPTPTPTPVPTTEPFHYAPPISVQQPSAMGIPQAWYPWLILIGFAPIWILLLYSIRKV